MQVLFEIMVQIKQKRGIGVENPYPRSFSGGNMIQNSLRILLLRRVQGLGIDGLNRDFESPPPPLRIEASLFLIELRPLVCLPLARHGTEMSCPSFLSSSSISLKSKKNPSPPFYRFRSLVLPVFAPRSCPIFSDEKRCCTVSVSIQNKTHHHLPSPYR